MTRATFSTCVEGTRRMVPAVATTLAGTAATIAGRTGAHHLNSQDHGSSAKTYATHRSPARFRQPANITKSSKETNPELWLDDYRLACQLGNADDDRFIIRNLPLFLADSARAWLEHLPIRRIHNWADLIKVFVGNF
jgi:hypothetical protein